MVSTLDGFRLTRFELRKVWTTWVSSLGISEAFFGLLKID